MERNIVLRSLVQERKQMELILMLAKTLVEQGHYYNHVGLYLLPHVGLSCILSKLYSTLKSFT
jgi:hypothetical protein